MVTAIVRAGRFDDWNVPVQLPEMSGKFDGVVGAGGAGVEGADGIDDPHPALAAAATSHRKARIDPDDTPSAAVQERGAKSPPG
jgi:hypothetical protein